MTPFQSKFVREFVPENGEDALIYVEILDNMAEDSQTLRAALTHTLTLKAEWYRGQGAGNAALIALHRIAGVEGHK